VVDGFYTRVGGFLGFEKGSEGGRTSRKRSGAGQKRWRNKNQNIENDRVSSGYNLEGGKNELPTQILVLGTNSINLRASPGSIHF